MAGLRVPCAIAIAFVPMLAARRAVAANPAGPHGGEKVFFAFDDHGIAWRHNLKLTLVPAKKHPANPVLRSGPKGTPDYGHAILYGTVLQDGDKFRMWYLGMIQKELERGQAPGWWRPMCYAESLDGVHWTKPELGLVELNGNTRNNICLIEGNPQSLTLVNDFLSILYEPDDPDPSRRYKAAYIAHMPYEEIIGGMSKVGVKEGRVGALVSATSADGLRWKVVGDRPANAGGERFEVSSLYRFGKFYYATGQLISPWTWRLDGSDVGRVMLAYRSPDFVSWSSATALSFARPGQLTNPPQEGQQLHMGAGLWNRGNVLVGLYGMWQDGPKERPKGTTHLHGVRIDLGLVVSSDGIHFREPVPNFKLVERGKAGEWDSIALLQGHAFAQVGDQTYIWYSHWDCEDQFRSQEIGLATMRRDGFGYLSRQQADAPGHCVTSPVPASRIGQHIIVNVEGVSEANPLTIELLDDRDRPLPGYSGANAATVKKAGTRQVVTWPARSDPLGPRDGAFSVRASFPDTGDVRLYAVYVEPASANAQETRKISIRRTPEKVRFGLIGEVGRTPAPTLFVFAHGIEEMERQPVYTEVADILSRRGWISVVVDPPCHGEDVRAGELPQLDGWRQRLERDEEFVPAFTAKARAILDELVKQGITDPERVAVCGTSRGGFLAFHFAASEPRIKAAAGISPVTKLLALREFTATGRKEKAERLDLSRLGPKLADRAIWLSIGNNDARVNTDDAISFTRAVVAASARPDKPNDLIPVELLVGPASGHSQVERAHERLAEWLVNRIPPPSETKQ